jgi:hypothetical protein
MWYINAQFAAGSAKVESQDVLIEEVSPFPGDLVVRRLRWNKLGPR